MKTEKELIKTLTEQERKEYIEIRKLIPISIVKEILITYSFITDNIIIHSALCKIKSLLKSKIKASVFIFKVDGMICSYDDYN